MRISTSQTYDRSLTQMMALNVGADRLQGQIATGKRIAAPSDDAAAFLRLDGLRRAGADDKVNAANLDLAQTLLTQTDSTLGQVETQLQRANEIAIQANGPGMNETTRGPLVEMLKGVIDDLLSLANTRDLRGQPLFGGAAGDTAYARGPDGAIAFAGTGEPSAIPIGEGTSIRASESGARIFGGAGDPATPDMFATLSALSAALQSGEPVDAAVATALTGIAASLDQVGATRASVGARMTRIELEQGRIDEVGIAREAQRSGIEDTDVASTITELQKTLTVLQATQASFSKLTSLTLFDYLR